MNGARYRIRRLFWVGSALMAFLLGRATAPTEQIEPQRQNVRKVAPPTEETLTPDAVRPTPEPAPSPSQIVAELPDVWVALAECETGGDWDYNGASGYDGGLQFAPSTWTVHKPPGAPPYAWQASPAVQIAAAEAARAEAGGFGPWPECAAKLGLPT